MIPSGTRAATRPGRLGGSLILLAVLVVAACLSLVAGPRGPGRMQAVVFAAAAAGAGSLAGWLAACRRAASPAGAVGDGLAAAALRLAPPLAGLAWLATGGGALRQAGADSLLVIFYLVLLATTIFLTIIGGRTGARNLQPSPGRDSPPPPGV